MSAAKIFIVILFLCTTLFGGDVIYTKRNNNYLREGPASFYNLIEIIPVGTKLTVVEKNENWLKVNFNGKAGWIAKNCLSESEPDKTMSEKLTRTWSSSKASRTGIAAAIKGFDKKTGKAIAGDIDLLLELSENRFSAQQFQEFKSELMKEKSRNKGRNNLTSLNLDVPEYDPKIRELQIGTGVASRIVAAGVIRDRQINDYVNMICDMIVESSRMYDWDFSVMIADDSKINGYACPGGYIFITKGAILKCSDEAELASIIAHEMAHIIQRHGLQEMTQRKVQIKADEAFSELEEDVESEYDSISTELENMIVNSYEKIVHNRLLRYETEADLISSVLIANAGYDPFGIVRSAKVLYQLSSSQTKDIFDDDYLAPDDTKIRYEKISKYAASEYSKDLPGAKASARFQKMRGSLK